MGPTGTHGAILDCTAAQFGEKRIRGEAIAAGIFLAVTILGLVSLLHSRDATVGFDYASFAAFGDPSKYSDASLLVHSSQSTLASIVVSLVAGHPRVGGSRLPMPISSDRGIQVLNSRFYSINGEPLSLEAVLSTVWNSTSSDSPIPPVIHYFLRQDLTRMQSVCLRSAVLRIQPAVVFIWLPSPTTKGGAHWCSLLASAEANGWSSRIVLAVNRADSTKDPEVEVHLLKLEALLIFGGIALEPDVFVLENPRRLLLFEGPVLGWNGTNNKKCNNSGPVDQLSVDVILSAPMSPLLYLWRLAILYARDLFGGTEWVGYNASLLLQLLHKVFPARMRIVKDFYQSERDMSDKGLVSEGYFVRIT